MPITNPIYVSIGVALNSLAPGASWICYNDDSYDNLEWLSQDIPKPTREEVESEIARLSELETRNIYQRNRAEEYPDLRMLADAIYHQQNGNDAPMEAYLALCQAVKDKYPKPV